jgi:hypothetical protein
LQPGHARRSFTTSPCFSTTYNNVKTGKGRTPLLQAPISTSEVVKGVLLNREDYGLAFEAHDSAYPEAFNHLILDWQDSSENAVASETWFGQAPQIDNGTAMGNMWGTAALILAVATGVALCAIATSAEAREDANAALESGHDELNKYLDQVDFETVTNADLMDLSTSLIKGQTQMMNTFYMMNRSVRSIAVAFGSLPSLPPCCFSLSPAFLLPIESPAHGRNIFLTPKTLSPPASSEI